MKIPEIIASFVDVVKKKYNFTDDQVIAYLKGAEDASMDSEKAINSRDAMLRDTVEQLVEAKRLLELAVEDIEKIAAVDECVYPYCDDRCPFIAIEDDCCDVKQWKHYDEAMKLIRG